MTTKRGLSLNRLIKNFMSKFGNNKAQAEPADDMRVECRNPWQHNLERLASVEHRYAAEPAPVGKTDSLSSFVTDLAKATLDAETTKTEAQKLEGQKSAAPGSKRLANRLGDRTINDMKAWWRDSLSPSEGENQAGGLSELPGKQQLLKRWFE